MISTTATERSHSRSARGKRTVLFRTAVLMVALAGLLAPLSQAGRPEASSSNLQATPNPSQSGGADYFVSGCGYVVGKQVNISVYEPSSHYFFPVPVDSDGCIFFKRQTNGPGNYRIEAWQNIRGKKDTLMAVTFLTVQ